MIVTTEQLATLVWGFIIGALSFALIGMTWESIKDRRLQTQRLSRAARRRVNHLVGGNVRIIPPRPDTPPPYDQDRDNNV